jgi:F0F1-type ATP synthase epsilon subunit
MQVSILSPRETIWQGKVSDLILPTEDGEMCVLDFHQPFLARLTKGEIRFGGVRTIFVKDGLAHMRGNELNILIES